MRAAGKIAEGMILKNQAGMPFKGGIAFGLAGVDRDFPAVLSGHDRLVVPVGSFDQADGYGQFVFPGPGKQVLQIGVGLPQVGLQHDAEVRIMPEFGACAQPPVDLQRDVLEQMVLHIDVEEAAHFNDLPVDHGQTPEDALHRALEIHGIDPGKKGGRLDGDIHQRGMPPVQIRAANGRPFPAAFLQGGQQLQIHIHRGRGLFFTDRGLAQNVNGACEPVPSDLFNGLQRFFYGLTDDELSGHGLQVGPDSPLHDSAGDPADDPGLACTPSHGLRDIRIAGGEIFFNVAGQGFPGAQVGEHIDKAEELGLETFVFHGPGHDPPHPPALVEEGRGFPFDACEKILAAVDDLLVQGGSVHAVPPAA